MRGGSARGAFGPVASTCATSPTSCGAAHDHLGQPRASRPDRRRQARHGTFTPCTSRPTALSASPTTSSTASLEQGRIALRRQPFASTRWLRPALQSWAAGGAWADPDGGGRGRGARTGRPRPRPTGSRKPRPQRVQVRRGRAVVRVRRAAWRPALVSDTGPGIPKALGGAVHPASTSRGHTTASNGLGLAIAATSCVPWAATWNSRTPPDRGQFLLTLPLEPPRPRLNRTWRLLELAAHEGRVWLLVEVDCPGSHTGGALPSRPAATSASVNAVTQTWWVPLV